MINIRKNSFETNSSSTHSICIPKREIKEYPKSIDFEFGDYGWEIGEAEPASYLYTALCNLYEDEERNERLNQLKEILDKYNIEYSFQPIVKKKWYHSNDEYECVGEIDHCYELVDICNSLLADDQLLLRYLINGEIYTGNDNILGDYNDEPELYNLAWDCPEPDKYDYFYKGN